MSIFDSPPKTTKYSFRHDDRHLGVGAIQLALNAIGATPIAVDGVFGDRTHEAVVRYQRNRGLTADGIAGPKTQARMAVGFERAAEGSRSLPNGLLQGLVEGESGNLIAAVNWSVSGGVDCGFTQRRVTGPPFSEPAVRKAFDSKVQIELLASQLASRFRTFLDRFNDAERSWRLAVLAHNWPYGADQLSRHRELSDRRATWVPEGTRFDDGAPVVTYADWANFYSMGSKEHNHHGRMVRYVTTWT